MRRADTLLRLLAAEAARLVGRGGARARRAQAAHRLLADLRRRVAVDPDAAQLVDALVRAALPLVGPTLRARRRALTNLNPATVTVSDAQLREVAVRARSQKELALLVGLSTAQVSRRLKKIGCCVPTDMQRPVRDTGAAAR